VNIVVYLKLSFHESLNDNIGFGYFILMVEDFHAFFVAALEKAEVLHEDFNNDLVDLLLRCFKY